MGLTVPAGLCLRQFGFSKRRWLDLRNGILFISPWIVGFGVFILYPVLASLYYSLTDFSVLQTPVFIGGANYLDLFKDDVFLKSLSNTFIYALFALPLGMITALTLALLLNTRVKGMAFYRTIFLLPSLVPLVAMAILWMWILNSQYGILNSLLSSLHLKGPNWLNDTHWSKPAIILTSLWGVGQSMVIYLASLQDVPVELYEACELDGAGTWQKVRHVTVPMISPVIYFNLVMGIIGTLQIFAVPYIMTAGGPARSTLFYAMHLYDNAFRYMRMGYACAMAWILFIIIILLTLVATRLSSRHVHYAGR
jgi:multiple sugar transport system permease protein